jgi:hypothetical protein
MPKTWNDAEELANALEERVLCGAERVILSPSTALWMARKIQNAMRRKSGPSAPASKFCVDLYGTGSCIISLDAKGDMTEILAWARNAIIARAAFEELCRREPSYHLQQRRKSWVEEERMVGHV